MSRESLTAYLQRIRKSGLVDSETLRQNIRQFRKDHLKSGGTDATMTLEAVSEYLLNAGILTEWQNKKFLEGHTKGFLLGRYKLLKHLGSGGMSKVYLAEHSTLRRQVAIKVLPTTFVGRKTYFERFLREARAIASLDHPNVVQAYSVDNEDDVHYIVMQYIQGTDLQRLVSDQGPLSFRQAADYIRQAALGLQHIHDKQLIHRDVKPANLMVDSQEIIKVMDLGLVHLGTEVRSLTLEHNENVLGTADYLAPEQAVNSHEVDRRVDIYALGCTLYFLLTAQPPFPSGTVTQRLMKHQHELPQPVSELRPEMPPGLLAIMMRMMAKHPSDRQSQAKLVAEQLHHWLDYGELPPNFADIAPEDLPGRRLLEPQLLSQLLPNQNSPSQNSPSRPQSGRQVPLAALPASPAPASPAPASPAPASPAPVRVAPVRVALAATRPAAGVLTSSGAAHPEPVGVGTAPSSPAGTLPQSAEASPFVVAPTAELKGSSKTSLGQFVQFWGAPFTAAALSGAVVVLLLLAIFWFGSLRVDPSRTGLDPLAEPAPLANSQDRSGEPTDSRQTALGLAPGELGRWLVIHPDSVEGSRMSLIPQSDGSTVVSTQPQTMVVCTVSGYTWLSDLQRLRLEFEALPQNNPTELGPTNPEWTLYEVEVEVETLDGHQRSHQNSKSQAQGSSPRKVLLQAIAPEDAQALCDGRPGPLVVLVQPRTAESHQFSRQVFLQAQMPFGSPSGTKITIRLTSKLGPGSQGRFRVSVASLDSPKSSQPH